MKNDPLLAMPEGKPNCLERACWLVLDERKDRPADDSGVNVVPALVTHRLAVNENASLVHRVVSFGSSADQLKALCNRRI